MGGILKEDFSKQYIICNIERLLYQVYGSVLKADLNLIYYCSTKAIAQLTKK